MYSFYIAGTKIPVNPSSFTISVPSQNTTVSLADDSTLSILRASGLKTFEFTMYLPQVRYPFADYTSGFVSSAGVVDGIIPPIQYLALLQTLKADKLPFQLDIYRSLPSGKGTWDTNETVSLEDYTVTEDAENGFDVSVDVTLKQYVHNATQKVTLSDDGLTYTVVRDTAKTVNRVIQAREGDTIHSIALRELGSDSSDVITQLYKLNYDTFAAYNNKAGTLPLTVHAGMPIKLTITE